MIERIANAMVLIFNSNLLWRSILIVVVLMMIRGAFKIQKQRDNNFDLLDFIRDFKTNRASRVGFFYMLSAVSTTAVYLYACTRPGVTVSEINIFTITYGGLGIASQGWNKQIERPPDPPPVILPSPGPQNQVNVGTPPPQEDMK